MEVYRVQGLVIQSFYAKVRILSTFLPHEFHCISVAGAFSLLGEEGLGD